MKSNKEIFSAKVLRKLAESKPSREIERELTYSLNRLRYEANDEGKFSLDLTLSYADKIVPKLKKLGFKVKIKTNNIVNVQW